jgi:hypothetical protein
MVADVMAKKASPDQIGAAMLAVIVAPPLLLMDGGWEAE